MAYLEFNFLLVLNHHSGEDRGSVRKVSQDLQGGHTGNKSRLLMAVCTARKRHIRHKFKWESLRLYIRKSFFTVRTLRY